ncbi:probable alcohol acetyltransferase [Nephila pilipes]|uniref:sn-1-specific diacylglycerol lipase ABHD11 n=1 Tax=Nephila pilipes TaxID=299642 RepID=A0A8X6TAK1_NEPPI|nr:probable alcohol acetyltransferase [Nephila pilipes]
MQEYRINKLFVKKFWILNYLSRRSLLRNMCSYTPARLAYQIFEAKEGADYKLAPVILQHGVIASKETWGDIPQVLADKSKRKVYTVDNRNHGDSEWSDSFAFHELSEDLLLFLKSRGIPKCVFIGHSMGGASGIRAALKKPHMFEMVFIEDSYVRSPSQRTFDFIKEFIKLTEEIVAEIPHHFSDDDAHKFIKERMEQRMPGGNTGIVTRKSKIVLPFAVKKKSDGGFVLKANVKRILSSISPFDDPGPEDLYDGPSYFMYGSNSPFKINEDEDHIKKHFRNAKLIPFEGAGHYIHLGFPEELTKVILEHLSEPQKK